MGLESALAGAAAAFLAALVMPALADRAQAAEDLVLEDWFAGRTYGEGVFRSWIAGVERRFSVVTEGAMEDGVFVLVEDFEFEDGESDRKTWRFTPRASGGYEGTREDVVGTADVRRADGAVTMRYDAELPRGDGTIRLHFSDTLELRADGTVLNRARVSKWGLPVGSVEVIFSKTPLPGT